MTEMPDGYSNHQPSVKQWLRDAPDHWTTRRIRTVAEMRVSNVDKHTREEEIPVRLCNYVDVYKNDRITQQIPFMRATASEEEIDKFKLNRNDVVITKDSETWDDIGVPALVTEPADDLISGYHLAILRPRADTYGPYLFWTLQSKPAAYQFHVEAKGVTRYGLAHHGIQSAIVPHPPLPEQAAIVRFLDHADEQIGRYIAGKERLIALLKEQRQALVHQAVTRGLDPNVRLKPSGVEWLGDVPEHWEIRRAKYLYKEVNERSETGAEQLLSVSHRTGVTQRKSNVTMFLAESNVGHKICQPGDIVINTMWAYMAALGVARQCGLVSPSYNVYRPHNIERLNDGYIDPLVRTEAYRTNYLVRSTGITDSRLRLYPESFLEIPFLCPPRAEQDAIVEYIARTMTTTEVDAARTRRQVDLMNEYRTRLIADVVTGQLDVRDAADKLTAPLDKPQPSHSKGSTSNALAS